MRVQIYYLFPRWFADCKINRKNRSFKLRFDKSKQRNTDLCPTLFSTTKSASLSLSTRTIFPIAYACNIKSVSSNKKHGFPHFRSARSYRASGHCPLSSSSWINCLITSSNLNNMAVTAKCPVNSSFGPMLSIDGTQSLPLMPSSNENSSIVSRHVFAKSSRSTSSLPHSVAQNAR